ncbi:alpha/beta-hydrolase [Aspergillus homomorphus CBS 101889]|uniref:Alpha/beta-hydrolase n=1 Tax=Aspergillus homomorphus (strain CBS 101889) TaxID=1450537 RepID=A0A395HX90_ASPHC|nr:alpha/beta-hydrolase [Aspergillus homomorphus CBS 101889]RAL12417.1 alpha/beta-hydrolase [Aspergillus homomorphus CBS 101889]
MPPPPRPQTPEGGKTLVYSTVDGHDIKLDYYLPRGTTSGKLPAIIYYHGGGMTAGSRRGGHFPTWLYDHCQKRNYILIAADYRLCHPSTALDQIADAKALLTFLTSPTFQSALSSSSSSSSSSNPKTEPLSLDPTRIAVTGFSAGAYSARAACVYGTPKPAVLMTAYGTGGNLLLDHWTQPRPPTSIAKLVNLDDVPRLLADKRVVSDDADAGSNRFALTVRWEMDGTFLDGCFGWPGLGAALNKVEYAERAAAVPAELRAGFLQEFVGEGYPPAVFVHGTADEVVPDLESRFQHEQLGRLGVRTRLLLVEGAGHGLVDPESGWPPRLAEGAMEAYEEACTFIDAALKGGL